MVISAFAVFEYLTDVPVSIWAVFLGHVNIYTGELFSLKSFLWKNIQTAVLPPVSWVFYQSVICSQEVDLINPSKPPIEWD